MQDPKPISADERAKRIERLRSIGIIEIPSTVPKLKLHGREIRIGRSEHQKNYYDVTVKSLDHLKLLVGNADRSLETNDKRNFVPYPMDACEVPDGALDDFTKLSRLEQAAVLKAAKNIVYGHSRALAFSESQFKNLTDWILKHGGTIPVLQSTELEVPDGTTVTFTDAGVLRFDVVTVHGSGSIRFEKPMKVIVDDMRVVP